MMLLVQQRTARDWTSPRDGWQKVSCSARLMLGIECKTNQNGLDQTAQYNQDSKICALVFE
jgi:hypothetical protein